MPYELTFTHPIAPPAEAEYINDCCHGGDVITARLLPIVTARYEDVDTGQEDWGWFIWFRQGAVRLAIDVFTDDPETGQFRIHLTARTTRLLVLSTVIDTPELEDVRALVLAELTPWVGGPVSVTRLDPDEIA